MTNLTKTLLLSTLLAAVASGPALADEGNKADDKSATECTKAGDHAQGATGDFYTDPHQMARKDANSKRYAASQPIPWQPGNPFRDDTGA